MKSRALLPITLASAIVLAIILSLAACSDIRLISDYDPQIDQGVSNLQKKVESILTKIDRSDRSRSNPSTVYSAADYDQIREDLNVLRTRAESEPQNQLTVKQLYRLGYALLDNPPTSPTVPLPQEAKGQSLEARNRSSAPLGTEDVESLRSLLEADFRNILRLELAKKRGEKATQ
jgi:hypothetical protein